MIPFDLQQHQENIRENHCRSKPKLKDDIDSLMNLDIYSQSSSSLSLPFPPNFLADSFGLPWPLT